MLAALHVQEGQRISEGDLLATLETTKSTADLMANLSGYIIGLRLVQGQTAKAGDILCFISERSDWSAPAVEKEQATGSFPDDTAALPAGLRITRPALALAGQLGIELEGLPTDRLVTESVLRRYLEMAKNSQRLAPPLPEFDPAAIIIYGGGGHGKALIELLQTLRIFRIIGIVDDGLAIGERILGIPVLGGAEALPDLYNTGVRQAVNAVGGIGNITTRIQVFERLKQAGFTCPAVVHPSAFVEASARLSPGTQIFPLAYLGSEAETGFGCIVNTGAIVSHNCTLGDYANISPGAMLAGEVQIGRGALVGMGATINLRVIVGAGARIGNGAAVKEDVPDTGIVRAGATWP
jgi:sugar O-acyltransferase (sialic acid O-acetyltransferase NeuD family)